METPTPGEQRTRLPSSTASKHSDTGPTPLGFCGALAMLIGSSYIVFSATRPHQQPENVRSPQLESALFASLVGTLALGLVHPWRKFTGYPVMLNGLHKWTSRILALFYLAVAAVELHLNDYVVPQARLPAELLLGVPVGALEEGLRRRFPGPLGYISFGYFVVGQWAQKLSPMAATGGIDLVFFLIFLLGGIVGKRLLESVSPAEAEVEEEKKED